jgi:hypothetical protein
MRSDWPPAAPPWMPSYSRREEDLARWYHPIDRELAGAGAAWFLAVEAQPIPEGIRRPPSSAMDELRPIGICRWLDRQARPPPAGATVEVADGGNVHPWRIPWRRASISRPRRSRPTCSTRSGAPPRSGST